MGLPIESAIDIAKRNITDIFTVEEWATKMEYSCPKIFSRKFRNAFGERPKPRLIKLRVDKFYGLIKKYPDLSCYQIALEMGLKGEIALNKFVKRHTGKPPTGWKNG
jgi:transcriptional regulator GlxA family with amidase domain